MKRMNNGHIWRGKEGQKGRFKANIRQRTFCRLPKRSTWTSSSLLKDQITSSATLSFKPSSVTVRPSGRNSRKCTSTKIWQRFGRNFSARRWFTESSGSQRQGQKSRRCTWSTWTALSMSSWQESLWDWPCAEVKSSECWNCNANKQCEQSFSSYSNVKSQNWWLILSLLIHTFLLIV